MAGLLDFGGDSPENLGLFSDLGTGYSGNYLPPFENAHPDFGPRLNALQDLLENTYGLKTKIGSGYRTPQQQAGLYAQGRMAPGSIVTNAPPGSSYHNYGAATDLVPQNMSEDQAGKIIGQAIQENPDLGLTWGGSFKSINDPLHVQLGVPLASLRNGQPMDYGDNTLPPNADLTQGLLGNAQPNGGGLLGRIGNSLTNPLVMFGLGLASGKTPQEGMGNALNATVASNRLQQQQQAQAAAYQAAIAAGANPQQAAALAMNPEAFKALQPQFHTLTGILGEQTPVFVSPFGKITGLNGQGQGVSQAEMNGPSIEPNYDANGKDPAFLSAVEKQYGPTVAKSIVDITEGRMPAMGRNLQKLIPLASRYDQNFTGMQDYQTRLQTAKSFAAGGKDADTVRSYNQGMEHAGLLWDMVDKLPTTNIGGPAGQVLNSAVTAYKTSTDPAAAAIVKRKNELGQALAGELMKASRQSGRGTLDEIKAWKQGFDTANSKDEIRGSLQGAMDFLQGAMDATARKKSEGLKSQFAPADLLSPENTKTFNKIQSYVPGGQAAPAATPQAPQAPAQRKAIPPQAADYLKANPKLRDQFDAKYGAGAAAQVLGQ